MAARKKFKLSERQRKELINAENQVKKPQLLKRIQCIKLKDLGREHKDVAKFLGVKMQSISRWTKNFLEGGINELLTRDFEGKVSFLTLQQLEEIRKKSQKKSFDTAKEIKDYIEKKFGIIYHLHHVQKMVKKNFDFLTRNPK